jgi:type II secretory ATPase GspE/PulE/Tfp pilus assembly ATPase PilB-like protein
MNTFEFRWKGRRGTHIERRFGLGRVAAGVETQYRAIKRQIQSKDFASDILDAAIAAGMHTLKQNGIEKVLRGDTDMQQVRAPAEPIHAYSARTIP